MISTPLHLRAVCPIIVGFRPDGTAISPRWRRAYKFADSRLLLRRARVDVWRLRHEPSRQKFPEYRFDVIHHSSSCLVSLGRSRIEQIRQRFLDLIGRSRGHIHVEQHSVRQHRDLGIAKQLGVPERRGVEISNQHERETSALLVGSDATRRGDNWSVGMGERNNLADTRRAIAPRLERSLLDAKIEVVETACLKRGIPLTAGGKRPCLSCRAAGGARSRRQASRR